MSIHTILLLPVAILITACASRSIPPVTQKMADDYQTDTARLNHGRDLYMQHCNRCHTRIFPAQNDGEAWRTIIPHMAEKAQITGQNAEDLRLYLLAASASANHLD